MKKLLGILVLSSLFVLIDSINPSKVEACHSIFDKKHSTFEKLKCKAENTIDDLNPLNYFEKRKECQRRADMADTVYLGKKRYKYCMENYPD